MFLFFPWWLLKFSSLFSQNSLCSHVFPTMAIYIILYICKSHMPHMYIYIYIVKLLFSDISIMITTDWIGYIHSEYPSWHIDISILNIHHDISIYPYWISIMIYQFIHIEYPSWYIDISILTINHDISIYPYWTSMMIYRYIHIEYP